MRRLMLGRENDAVCGLAGVGAAASDVAAS